MSTRRTLSLIEHPSPVSRSNPMTDTPEQNELATAISMAVVAHAEQVDKQGAPYILHVFRVAASVASDEERIVAWLHDIVEDTDCGIDDLVGQFSPRIVQAVSTLTRDKREPYEDYIRRVALNDLATVVKIADLRDNLSRIDGVRASYRARLEPRYRRALEILGSESGAGDAPPTCL